MGVSVWPEEYGICIESAHFSLGLRVWDRRFCMSAGVCDTESVYWFFFYCPTCEEEHMSDFFVLMS